MAVNNALTKEYLSQLSNKVLLAFVHPLERARLVIAMGLPVTKKWGT
jgi:hypothetical protein